MPVDSSMATSALLFEIIRYLFYALIIAGWIFGISLIIKAYTKRRRAFWLVKQKYTTILIQVPRNNEKGPLSAQLMFASLHGIYKSAKEKLEEGSFQEHISFEIVSTNKYIRFYIYTPIHLKDFVQGQVYAQYPNVEMSEVEDYTLAKRPAGTHFVGTELGLTREDVYPIKTFLNFEVDPLAGITGVLSQVAEGEQIWVQILAKPVEDNWHKRSIAHVNALKAGKKSAKTPAGVVGKIFSVLFLFLKLLFTPDPLSKDAKTQVKLSGPVEQALKAIEEKSTKLGYASTIRLVFLSNKSQEEMKIKMQSIAGAFKQYNASNLNGFIARGYRFDDLAFLNEVQTRSFERRGYILNIEELASLYHLPTLGVETPTIAWAGSKKGEPPAILPVEGTVPDQQLTVFARTNFRDKMTNFGIKENDRRRHMYIIGQTGTGKSTAMKIMAIDDIHEGRGLAIIDPHSEFIDSIMDYIPEERIKDVVIFDPGDREHCLGFNLLENVDPIKREILASGMMSIFKKIWEGVWSARMEYIMKNLILALMETPGTTMLSATKMLVNKEYRKMIVDNIKDPVVREYWTQEFEVQVKTNPKFATEAIAPIQNKIGQFLSVPSIRNIIGQPHSTIDFQDIMDNKKILLVRISKGEIGEDNMALLGAMIITKIQLTAMERSGRLEEDMNDFYLYVDEFQNFATSSFATILAEARKYKLNLIIAHQYISQMEETIRDAVFGNVGNTIAFRVSVDDAPTLKKTFEPVFDETDLVNLDNFHIYVKMMIDNTVTPAFSAITINYKDVAQKYMLGEKLLAYSREHYTVPKEQVEKAIWDWSESMANLDMKGDRGERGERGYGRVNPSEMGEGTNAPGVQQKPKESYREIKDKTGGAWYVRKTQNAKLKTQNVEEGTVEAKPAETAQPVVEEEKVEVGDQEVHGHEEIKDVPIGEHEIAEDFKNVTFARRKDDEGTIEPGEVVEM